MLVISRDFLCGFRKRKQERRRVAKDELEKQVKLERKRIKQEVSRFFRVPSSFPPYGIETASKKY